MTVKEWIAVAAAVFAIAFGVILLWYPPASLAGQAGTVGTALAFITGGLGALGVTMTIPAAFRIGYKEGYTDSKGEKASKYP